MIEDMKRLSFFDMIKPYNNRSSIDRGYRAEEKAIKAKYSTDMLELGLYLYKLLIAHRNYYDIQTNRERLEFTRQYVDTAKVLRFERFKGAILEFDIAFLELETINKV